MSVKFGPSPFNMDGTAVESGFKSLQKDLNTVYRKVQPTPYEATEQESFFGNKVPDALNNIAMPADMDSSADKFTNYGNQNPEIVDLSGVEKTDEEEDTTAGFIAKEEEKSVEEVKPQPAKKVEEEEEKDYQPKTSILDLEEEYDYHPNISI